MQSRRQTAQVFTMICVLIGVLVTVQLWLLSASVEALLGGQVGPAVPATISSFVLFCVSAGVLRYASATDRRPG